DIVEAIRKAIQDQGIDPGTLRVLRDTTVKNRWVTDRFCVYRYLDEDTMSENPTTVSEERPDTTVRMDMVREDNQDEEPEVTSMRRIAFEPSLGTTPTTVMA